MKIKYLRAKNFLSIGDTPVEIDFTKYGNIVNVKGINFDSGADHSNGSGKCFAPFTKILMFDGTTKNVQDIKIDDLVMGDDSTPRRVLNLHSGYDKMYDVIPKKGKKYTVNGYHVLALKSSDKKSNLYYKNKFHVGNGYFHISTFEYLNQSKCFKHLMSGYRSGVEFKSREVKIDPYFLGVWLGDGTTGQTEVLTWGKYRNSLKNDMDYYGVRNYKHVPEEYKINSREVRLQILAGLIDTDGSRSGGGYDFINKIKAVSEGVVFLARSLGLAAYMSKCTKKCQTGAVGTYWRVNISGDCSIVPTRIPRKKCPSRRINKDPLVVGIKVKPRGIGKYFGFQVDGNGLFLLGDFTVVHNSTIFEAIVYGVYGKMIKGLNHKNVINVKNKSGLEVEVHWDDYKVIRKREPNRLQIFQGNKDITPGKGIDEFIRGKIGLDHNSFINVACFGQHNVKPFLSCDSAEKRKIAENLLSLDRYLIYHEVAKKKLKALQNKIEQLSILYERSTQEITTINKKKVILSGQQQNWDSTKRKEVADEENKIHILHKRIHEAKTREDVKNYENVQQELSEIEATIDQKDKNRADLHAILIRADTAIQQKKDEKQELSIKMSNLERELAILYSEIKEFQTASDLFKEKKDGTCPVCYGEITDKNITSCLEHNLSKIKERQTKCGDINRSKSEIAVKLGTVDTNLQKLLDGRKLAREKELDNLNDLNALTIRRRELEKIKKPDAASEIALLDKDLQHAVDRAAKLKEELVNGSPYLEIIKITADELKTAEDQSITYKNDLKLAEDDIPYYSFWVKGFGDEGIRSFVINEVIPTINARINYWLQFLMDGRLRVDFNSELDEIIRSVPDYKNEFIYNSLSGGEHNRVDLAISQAFAHLMVITSGSCPSILVLDEICTNIDRPGIQAIYKMICELSRDRQVFIITHDPDLLDLLSEHETLTVSMRNGFTTLI